MRSPRHRADAAGTQTNPKFDFRLARKPHGLKILRASLSLSKSNWGVQFSSCSQASRAWPGLLHIGDEARSVLIFGSLVARDEGPGSCAGCHFHFGIYQYSNLMRPPRA